MSEPIIGDNQCKHGCLARSCNICELEAELSSLKAECEILRGALEYIYPFSDHPDAMEIAKKALSQVPLTTKHVRIQEAMEKVVETSRIIAQTDWQSDFAIEIINLNIALSNLDRIKENKEQS